MRRRMLVCLLVFMAGLSVWAQKPAVSGTVVNSATGEHIGGASVAAEGTGISTVTNGDGDFVLKADTLPAAILVSHLGFRTERVDLAGHDGGKLKIKLHPTSIQLQEIVVMSDDPRLLVEAAIRKIPKNYPDHAELYGCFYRETTMKRQHYISVAEGVVDMYKTGYGRGSLRDRVAIRKGRRLLSPRSSDTLSVKVNGGPVAAVMLDVVKNTTFLFNKEDLDCYEMKMEIPERIGDRMQYVVSIAPLQMMPWALYFGKLYIDQETLAFTRADLTLDMRDRDKATRMMLVRKPGGVRFRPKELSCLVDYRLEDGVTRLSYIRTTFRFNCDWRRRFFATAFTATCEMVVTEKGLREAVPIKGHESFDSDDAFFDKVEYFRDPTFWQDYNIIEPTESLDKAIERIVKRY